MLSTYLVISFKLLFGKLFFNLLLLLFYKVLQNFPTHVKLKCFDFYFKKVQILIQNLFFFSSVKV